MTVLIVLLNSGYYIIIHCRTTRNLLLSWVDQWPRPQLFETPSRWPRMVTTNRLPLWYTLQPHDYGLRNQLRDNIRSYNNTWWLDGRVYGLRGTPAWQLIFTGILTVEEGVGGGSDEGRFAHLSCRLLFCKARVERSIHTTAIGVFTAGKWNEEKSPDGPYGE